ncbi:MAG: Rieske 2Fe-2S domain-containing protein [Gammaproteobacteria bacterium]|nr:Rieske 2Fe-2S domain-containing protein [Gammaproteobacteria bacterium]MBQ0839235.1 Rieske 2Fe-2S domain-containing protein [Gammaproteobacteria bacterium]
MKTKARNCPTESSAANPGCPCRANAPTHRGRRRALKLGLLGAAWSPLTVFAARKPGKMRPQAGDHLVFAYGERQGEIISPGDLTLNAKPIEAYPKQLASNVIRDRSRLNALLLVRLDPQTLPPTMDKYAANGLVAYSAVCTHTGCTVEGWDPATQQMSCPCHGSQYAAGNAAKVLMGPAPKPLAMLPLSINSGELTVAGAFSRKVGFKVNKY